MSVEYPLRRYRRWSWPAARRDAIGFRRHVATALQATMAQRFLRETPPAARQAAADAVNKAADEMAWRRRTYLRDALEYAGAQAPTHSIGINRTQGTVEYAAAMITLGKAPGATEGQAS